jgi:hypothetical protein
VQVEPHPLDLVVVRAVGREEVEHHPVIELGEEALRPLTRADDVVVHDEVDPPGVAVLSGELPDERAERLLALLADWTQVSFPVAALSAPATKRFWFLPGVTTYRRWPGSIQSRPIFGLR